MVTWETEDVTTLNKFNQTVDIRRVNLYRTVSEDAQSSSRNERGPDDVLGPAVHLWLGLFILGLLKGLNHSWTIGPELSDLFN